MSISYCRKLTKKILTSIRISFNIKYSVYNQSELSTNESNVYSIKVQGIKS